MLGNIRFSQRTEWADGQPISELMAMALANPQLISLAAGFVDQQTLPVEPTRRALDALYSDTEHFRAALQYGTTAGFPPLREALLARHLEQDGATSGRGTPTVDHVVCTAGSNQLLHLVGECLLDPGDIVLCAAPSYLVYLGILYNLGARPIGIGTDEAGMIPEALEEALQHLDQAGTLPRVKAIYVVSYFDNPSGATISVERRSRIVELAKRWSSHGKIHVIEDMAYRELRYQGPDLPSMQTFDEDHDTVVVTGTFSKPYSPGIRVGWGILPAHLVEPICNQKGNIDFGSPNFAQHVMAKILELDLFDPHIAEVRQSYRSKLAAMLAAADQFLRPLPDVHWNTPTGGLYVWLQMPQTVKTGPTGDLLDAAIEEGMFYVPGEYCYSPEGEPVRENMIRLSFGVQSEDRIQQGVEALARAARRVLG